MTMGRAPYIRSASSLQSSRQPSSHLEGSELPEEDPARDDCEEDEVALQHGDNEEGVEFGQGVVEPVQPHSDGEEPHEERGVEEPVAPDVHLSARLQGEELG